MNANTFNAIVGDTHQKVDRILVAKGKEYATEDQLHNFKITAEIRKCTPIQALSGMMAKHTVSIYDMLESDDEFSLDIWDEKIIDHINYLILLRALIMEHQGEVALDDDETEDIEF